MDQEERDRELARRICRRQAERKRKQKQSSIKWSRFIPAVVLIVILLGGLGFGLVKGVTAIYNWIAQPQGQEEVLVEDRQTKAQVPSVALNQEALDKPIYILLAGRDANNPSEVDSLYLVSVNLEQKLVDVIGIPANTKIDNRSKTGADKINTFYKEGGIELSKAVVEDMFHISIPYYVVMDEADFVHTVDVVGTQSFYVETAMTHRDGESGLEDINLKKGYQDLDGNKALQYVRYTEDPQDVFSRVGRQERFMKSLLASVRDSFTLTNAWDVWRTWSHFESNISTWDAIKLVYRITHMEADHIHFYILPGHKDSQDGQTFWVIDPSEAQRLVGIMTGDIEAAQVAAPKNPIQVNRSIDKDGRGKEEQVNVPDNQKSPEEREQEHSQDPRGDKGI